MNEDTGSDEQVHGAGKSLKGSGNASLTEE